jgi:hypothetical protein
VLQQQHRRPTAGTVRALRRRCCSPSLRKKAASPLFPPQQRRLGLHAALPDWRPDVPRRRRPHAHARCHRRPQLLPVLTKPLFLVSDLDDTLLPGAYTDRAKEEHTLLLRDALAAGCAAGRVALGEARRHAPGAWPPSV